MTKMQSVVKPQSFRTVVQEYESVHGGTHDDRAHLRRWADDKRADEVWQKIAGAAQTNGLVLPPGLFISESLSCRRMALGLRLRGRPRKEYQKATNIMGWLAKFFRRPHPHGMPGYPRAKELAGMLEKAASYYGKQVEVTRKLPEVVKFTRESKPHMIFMSLLGNYLKEITGHWLDKEVAVLTEIAFDSPDAIEPEAVRWARGQRGRRRMPLKRHG
jgi:hypothetical protein